MRVEYGMLVLFFTACVLTGGQALAQATWMYPVRPGISAFMRYDPAARPRVSQQLVDYSKAFSIPYVPFAPSTEQGIERMPLTPERWKQLVDVDRAVNHAISYQWNTGKHYYGDGGDSFLSNPLSLHYIGARANDGRPQGQCGDYALAKQEELLTRGWPTGSVVYAAVVDKDGDHAVLLVHTDHGDLILDNDPDNGSIIKPWVATQYTFRAVQMNARSPFVTRIAPAPL